MIETTYIFHDCFLLKTPDCAVLFDFWTDPLRTDDKKDPAFLDLIDKDKPFIVIVSHHHKDHFNREIYKWAERFPEIRYIISKDTFMFSRYIFSQSSTHNGPKVDPSKVWMMRPGETWPPAEKDLRQPGASPSATIPGGNRFPLSIHAFGSTDIGNSYLIETAGIRIFHAGDLNAWVWKDESTQEEVEEAIRKFDEKLDPIENHLILDGCKDSDSAKRSHIDLMFFPVDSRIGSEYWTGAKIILNRFDVERFIPMHFGLGTEEEQTERRINAAKFYLYADPRKKTTFVGPLAPYGSFCFTP